MLGFISGSFGKLTMDFFLSGDFTGDSEPVVRKSWTFLCTEDWFPVDDLSFFAGSIAEWGSGLSSSAKSLILMQSSVWDTKLKLISLSMRRCIGDRDSLVSRY